MERRGGGGEEEKGTEDEERRRKGGEEVRRERDFSSCTSIQGEKRFISCSVQFNVASSYVRLRTGSPGRPPRLSHGS